MIINRIVWYYAQVDKMPKYDKMPKVIMPKWHFALVWQNAQGDKMPKSHYAQGNKMPKMSLCPNDILPKCNKMPKSLKKLKCASNSYFQAIFWHYFYKKYPQKFKFSTLKAKIF